MPYICIFSLANPIVLRIRRIFFFKKKQKGIQSNFSIHAAITTIPKASMEDLLYMLYAHLNLSGNNLTEYNKIPVMVKQFLVHFAILTSVSFAIISVYKKHVSSDPEKFKIPDSIYRFFVYGYLALLEMFVVNFSDAFCLFEDYRTMFDLEHSHLNFNFGINTLFAVEMAHYASQLCVAFIHRSLYCRREDYVAEQIHHAVSLALMAGAVHYGYARIGFVLLCYMDVSDVFLNLSKVLKYAKAPKLMLYSAFFVFLSSWIYCRVFMVYIHVLSPCAFLSLSVIRSDGLEPSMLHYYLFMSGLIVIWIIQWMWTYMIWLVVKRLFLTGDVVDVREPKDDAVDISKWTNGKTQKVC